MDPELFAKQSNRHNDSSSGKDGLCDPENNREAKKGPATRPIAGCFRPRDKCHDGVVEAEDAKLTDQVRAGPRHRENAQRGWTENPRDQEGKNATKIRGNHRDRVQERAAFQFHAGLIHARRGIYRRWRDGRRAVDIAHSVFNWPDVSRCIKINPASNAIHFPPLA